MRKILLAIIFLLIATFQANAEIQPQYLNSSSAGSSLGVEIHKDLNTVPSGESITGTVADPQKLAAHGFRHVEKGDKLIFTNIGDGNWKLKLMSTGEEKLFKMQK